MAKSKEGFGHEEYKPYENLHLSVGRFDGGQCVGPHEGYYKQRDSCSYRWQAVYRATTSDKALYGPGLSAAIRKRKPKQALKLFRNRALTRAPGANPGDNQMFVTAHPFRTGFSPWVNNAHHLLPDAQLKAGIFSTALGEAEVERLIIQGLLTNKYNLNLWKNMLILPQEHEVGCSLGLPTHPQGDSHPAYSAAVRSAVDRVLTPYKAVVEQVKANKPHDSPDPVDIVAALEALSMSLHAAVLATRPAVVARCANEEDVNLAQFSASISAAIGV